MNILVKFKTHQTKLSLCKKKALADSTEKEQNMSLDN